MRGSLRPNNDCNILTPLLWSSALCLSRSPDAQPEGWGPTLLVVSTASYHQLVWSPNSIGGPEGPFGRVWLSLPHLVTITSELQPSDFLSWPIYIIVQRQLNRPLNLWNSMIDRHQAKITVMQFRGHSLPVHQSMSVSLAFTLSHFISQIRPRDLFRLLAIGMSLPSGASLCNRMFARAEGQYITHEAIILF